MVGNILFVAALLSAIGVTFFAYQMMAELNRQLPKAQQFTFWNARGKILVLGHKHKMFYPVSNKRLLFNVLLMLTFALICVGLYLHFR